jgi:MoxR-like ATPase
MALPPDQPILPGAVIPEPARDPRGPILALRTEIGKVVVGQEGTLSGLVAALLVRGHVLLEGVPGTAKTLLVKSMAAALDLDSKRVQFTPDLMPSDVVGQVIFEPREATFRFREGPVFTNLLLADEINRTPPKTQAALLEAMEERQVSIEGVTHPLPDPFIVVATQNPVEYEGTYPLPEAQLDRFLFKLQVGYPTFEQEQEMLARHDQGLDPHDVIASGIRPVANAGDLAAARVQIDRLRMEVPVQAYVVALVRATRESPSVLLGVSPEGGGEAGPPTPDPAATRARARGCHHRWGARRHPRRGTGSPVATIRRRERAPSCPSPLGAWPWSRSDRRSS